MIDLNIVTSSIYDYLRSVLESGFGVMFIILTAINTISLCILLWQFKKKHRFSNKFVQNFLNNSFINHLALLLFEAIKVQIICDTNYFKKPKKLKNSNVLLFYNLCSRQTSNVFIFYYKLLELFQSKIYFKFRIPF